MADLPRDGEPSNNGRSEADVSNDNRGTDKESCPSNIDHGAQAINEDESDDSDREDELTPNQGCWNQ